MRDANRLKERFTLSLDGRQVASIVVGSLVFLAAVFLLGFWVGRQLGQREAPAAPVAADPLAALDAPGHRSDAGEPPPRLSYHEALTKERPRSVEPLRTAAPGEAPPPAAPTPPAASPAASPPRPPVSAPPPASEPRPAKAGVFAIQVGATQERAEAERLADRFRAHRPRIVEAVVAGKGRWYRVKLGSFETREDAERYLRDLGRETGAKGFVTAWN